jgi:hypothetical protein
VPSSRRLESVSKVMKHEPSGVRAA